MTEMPPGASPVDAIVPGTRLREWEIVRFVGRGSYGVVFEARRSSWLAEPPRALKVFDPIISAAARSALLGEFATLTEARHPHLLAGVDAFDLVEPPYAGCVVFVLELADEDLAHRVARSGPLPAAEAAAVGADVADGLAALHAQGRIHGDVKPENVLRVDDRWVLGDFGVTGVLEGSYAVTRGATIDYRPPELARADEGTPQHRSADVWALGVSLHVAATGRHPFPGPDPMMRYAAVVRGDRATAPGLDPALAAVIDEGCLVPDPHGRLGAAALATRLRAVAAPPVPAPPQGSASAPPDGSADPVAPPVPSHPAAPVASPPDPAPPDEPAGPDRPPPGAPVLAPAPSSGLGVAPAAPGGPPVRDPAAAPGRRAAPAAPTAVPAAVAAAVTLVITQVVAVAAGALLDGLAARRTAYVVVSLALVALGVARYRSRVGARAPAVHVVAGTALVVWIASTVVLFV